jgi:hypothetical protein
MGSRLEGENSSTREINRTTLAISYRITPSTSFSAIQMVHKEAIKTLLRNPTQRILQTKRNSGSQSNMTIPPSKTLSTRHEESLTLQMRDMQWSHSPQIKSMTPLKLTKTNKAILILQLKRVVSSKITIIQGMT